MRALHPVVNSAVALFLLALAMEAAAAQAPAGKIADTQASPKAEASAQDQQIAQPTLAPETQSVHIQVGRSIVLNTQSRLRRIVVVIPTFSIRLRSARLRWWLQRKRQAAAVLCCGMKGRTPGFWMSMPTWTFPGCEMESGRHIRAKPSRLRRSREECWSAGK